MTFCLSGSSFGISELPQLEGLLATDRKKSPDGLTYTFALRHGVKFSDGTPFKAAAAKASFNVAQQSKVDRHTARKCQEVTAPQILTPSWCT